MELVLSMNLDNASFDAPAEGAYRSGRVIAEVLRAKADEIEAMVAVCPGDWGICRDGNGNAFGHWMVER